MVPPPISTIIEPIGSSTGSPAPIAAAIGSSTTNASRALAFSAAANLGHSGTALALALASGYAGSIVGPVLIGSVADHFGLRAAMTVPLVSALVIVVLAGSLTVSRAAVSPQPARR